MSWLCFVIEPTDRARYALRRYKPSNSQLGRTIDHVCEAMTPIEDGPAVTTPAGYYVNPDPGTYADDTRWPDACATCGYRFTDDDIRQVFTDTIYRAEDGREMTLRDAEPGAMWRAWWMEHPGNWTGPDGQTWVVMTPGGDGYGEWIIDGPSSNGGRWTRTGTPPAITARPSILTPRYHDWLTDGVLSDDLDGRTYDAATGE